MSRTVKGKPLPKGACSCWWCTNSLRRWEETAPTVEEQLREYDPDGDAAEARLLEHDAFVASFYTALEDE